MTDGQSQTPKERSKGFLRAPKIWLKKTFSQSTSPRPFAFGQENRGGELSSAQHAIVSSGRQWIDPVLGASPALSQQGIFHTSLSPRYIAQTRTQFIPPLTTYQDRSYLPQVQAYLDLQLLTVRDFEDVWRR